MRPQPNLKARVTFFSVMLILLVVAVSGLALTVIEKDDGQFTSANRKHLKDQQEAIDDFIAMTTRSRLLTTSWVYMPTNMEDKGALRKLQEVEHPVLKDRLGRLMPSMNDTVRTMVREQLIAFDSLTEAEVGVIGSLVTIDDYDNPVNMLLAEYKLENDIIPQCDRIIHALNAAQGIHQTMIMAAEKDQEASVVSTDTNVRVFVLVTFILTCACALYFFFGLRLSRTEESSTIR